MFDKSIVIAKCPHFDWGIDGNHATCMRYSPFIDEPPECARCDVYKELTGEKVVDQMSTEKLTYMFKIDDPYWSAYEKVMTKIGDSLYIRENEGIEDALRECGFVRERTCTCKELHYDKSLEEFVFSLSCGHTIFFSNLPSYCPECGAKVVDE